MIATSRTAMSEAFHIVARLDPITILIATGLRRSELLALRWDDYDDGAGTITVTGKVVRVAGKGLMRGSAVSRAGDCSAARSMSRAE
jgi:integrase